MKQKIRNQIREKKMTINNLTTYSTGEQSSGGSYISYTPNHYCPSYPCPICNPPVYYPQPVYYPVPYYAYYPTDPGPIVDSLKDEIKGLKNEIRKLRKELRAAIKTGS